MIIVPWSTRTKEYEPFRISAFMNHKSKLLSFGLLNAVAAFPSLAIAGGSDRPNIILIMVDDMGYSDLGIYGSEIETPNLDRLAREGIRFREFYNNSISAPTRASLITGQYSHSAGIGYFNVNLGQPGYQGFLNRESLTFGEVLREAGYNTFLSGKWHVGNDSICWPAARGFDRSYGFISGASNYYDAGEYASDAPSAYGNTVSLVKDNQRTTLEPGRYLTNAITDNALEFIDQREKDQPFFLYLAFNAPHWPLQAPTEDIAKYKGRYAKGWDALREERIARQKELGILTPGQTIAERDPDVPLWENLTFEQKELWQKKMEIYAAMVDRVDQNIGRIIEKLKETGEYDNTMIVFLSDNGAEGGYTSLFRKRPRNGGPMGSAGSWEYQEQPWAYLSVTPLRQYKDNFHEGGFCTSFIAWYPKRIPQGQLVQGTGHIIDIAPTLYEIAEADYPSQYKGHTIQPLPGESLWPVLEGKEQVVSREEPLFWERAGNRAVRSGQWKLVSTYPSLQWELYDLSNDRGETRNIASEYPDIVDRLSAQYFEWAKTHQVIDYDRIKPEREIRVSAKPVQH